MYRRKSKREIKRNDLAQNIYRISGMFAVAAFQQLHRRSFYRLCPIVDSVLYATERRRRCIFGYDVRAGHVVLLCRQQPVGISPVCTGRRDACRSYISSGTADRAFRPFGNSEFHAIVVGSPRKRPPRLSDFSSGGCGYDRCDRNGCICGTQAVERDTQRGTDKGLPRSVCGQGETTSQLR